MNTPSDAVFRRFELPRSTHSPSFFGLLAAALALVAVGCGPEPLEFSEWTIPVADGTRVHGYAHVAEEERSGRHLELVRDLVIGDSGAPEETFYQPRTVAVDADGRMYVLDAGNKRVQVFDAEGKFVVSFGNEGQGPGEFTAPIGIGVADDRVLVTDRTNARISVFTLDGEHLDDHAVDRNEVFSQFRGLSDGSLVVEHVPPIPLGVADLDPVFWTATRRGSDWTLRTEYLSLPYSLGVHATQELSGGGMRFWSVPMSGPRPSGAFDASGRLYATQGDRYQVLALGPEGEQLWAVRVAFGVHEPSEADVAAVMAYLHERDETLTRDHVSWPEQYPAIARMLTDGNGNLYVFPYVFRQPALEGEEEFAGPWAVDVYAPSGERLFAGTINVESWRAAHGDHVYTIETDPNTEEPVLVRYRIEADF